MAYKFLRRQKWWIKFRHPQSGEVIRESLQTHDPARADLLLARVEAQLQLLEPRIQNVELPESISKWLQVVPAANAVPHPALSITLAPAPQTSATVPIKVAQERATVNHAMAAYVRFIRSENGSAHVANKVSIFRRFLEKARMEKIGGPAKVKNCGRKLPSTDAVSNDRPFSTGTYLDEITPVLLQDFIEGLGVGRDTMRHHRQCFRHWFAFCLKFDLYHATNWHRPNPMSGLPGDVTRNRRITFLTEEQIGEQLGILRGHPSIRMAIAIMIYARLRLSETLWLTRVSISADFSFLSVRNRTDEDLNTSSSLKTGERTVTILPKLKQELEMKCLNLRDYPHCYLLTRPYLFKAPGEAGKHKAVVKGNQILFKEFDASFLSRFHRQSGLDIAALKSQPDST